MVLKAIHRFGNRTAQIEIPKNKSTGVHGFSHEYINYMLGGTFRGSYTPLNDNIINGRIRGVAGVVGCTNPPGQAGLGACRNGQGIDQERRPGGPDRMLPGRSGQGRACVPRRPRTWPAPGSRRSAQTVGMPPVLGLGSCVDNSRILIACAEMVKTGGLGESIADLPVAGAAPEWMSEKAISIGHYFVASGVFNRIWRDVSHRGRDQIPTSICSRASKPRASASGVSRPIPTKWPK